MALSRENFLSLKRAYRNLEQSSLAIRLADSIGTPIEAGIKLLPRLWRRRLQRCTENAIWKALGTVVASLENKPGTASRDMCHKLLGIATGAVGGFLGGPALLMEFPFTTTIMLRSIADIARSEGESLDDIESRLACLEVFALGGRSNRMMPPMPVIMGCVWRWQRRSWKPPTILLGMAWPVAPVRRCWWISC